MSGNNENNGPNWLGLLRWSVAYSDGTAPSNATAMSEEDKQWLERVMKEGVRDDVQRMNEIMTKVKNSDFTDIEMELEDLKDIVEQVDMAQVFTKCGGCEVLLQFIEERVEIPPAIRALAASVIATVAQNNLIAQDAMMSAKVVDKLAALFLDTSSDLLATKILYALSCTVRGHAAAEEHFSLILSEAIIAKVLQTRAGSIVSRAAFLTNALITSDYCTNHRINKFVHAFLPGIFELLTSESQADGRDQIYTLLSTLLQTKAGYDAIRGRFHDSFTQVIESRVRQLEGEEQSEEREHELRQIADLQSRAQTFEQSYPSTTARENHRLANPDTSSNATVAAAAEPTVLMIAPPPLEASSEAP